MSTTEGPWKIVTYGDNNQYQDIQDKKGNSVCTRHNARLIAAAPQLLEALKLAAEWLDNMKASQSVLTEEALLDCQPQRGGMNTLRAAIAQAEGKD